jgi:2-phospho-L-lactate/phosphoenolpyruvate guanylyltransferase
MTTAAILPVKSLADVKSRLSSTLSQGERSALAVELLTQSARAVIGSGAVERCAIVSPDPNVLALAISLGAFPILQQAGGLNDALNLGRGWADSRGASRVLIILPDLPLLSAHEVEQLVALSEPDTLVLAPDRHNSGTNGLIVEIAQPLRFAFGINSFRRHRQEAERLGLTLRLYHSTGTEFDIDTPLDLRYWRSMAEEVRIA